MAAAPAQGKEKNMESALLRKKKKKRERKAEGRFAVGGGKGGKGGSGSRTTGREKKKKKKGTGPRDQHQPIVPFLRGGKETGRVFNARMEKKGRDFRCLAEGRRGKRRDSFMQRPSTSPGGKGEKKAQMMAIPSRSASRFGREREEKKQNPPPGEVLGGEKKKKKHGPTTIKRGKIGFPSSTGKKKKEWSLR